MSERKDSLISIIIPVYNTERYLSQCIDSVLSQSYRNIELILVDDGSNDGSSEVCEEYKKKDSRVKVIHKSNGGQLDARRKGVDEANGEYIGFVDSDDWIDGNMYEELLAMMQDADLISSSIKRQNTNSSNDEVWMDNIREGNYLVDCDYVNENLIVYSKYEGGKVIGGISNNMVNKVYKKDIVDKILSKIDFVVYDEEDFLFNIMYLLNANKIAVTHKAYYNYRNNNNGMSVRKNENYLLERAKIYEIVKNEIIINNRSCRLLAQLQKRIIYELFSVGYKMGFGDECVAPIYYSDKLYELTDKVVIIFGVGQVGKSYIKLLKRNCCKLLGYIDNKVQGNIMGVPHISLKELNKLDYDLIICAIENEYQAQMMSDELIDYGVETSKIKWFKPTNIAKELFLKG